LDPARSGFGRPRHPAWTYHLLARPDAVISWRGEEVSVSARLLEGDERAAVWRRVLEFWPSYAPYQARAAREIRLFPAPSQMTDCAAAAGADGTRGE